MPRWSPRACRELTRISSPLSSFGTPRPSQRSKLCSTVSRTSWSRPTRDIRSSAARQCFSSMDSATRRPSPRHDGTSARRRFSGRTPPQMTHHEQGPGGGVGEVDLAEVALECHLVSKPLSLLVGVDVTPNHTTSEAKNTASLSSHPPGRAAQPARARSGIAGARAPSAGPCPGRRRATARPTAQTASPRTAPRSSSSAHCSRSRSPAKIG